MINNITKSNKIGEAIIAKNISANKVSLLSNNKFANKGK